MVTRVGSYGQMQLLQQQMQKLQAREADSQRQVASGYKARDFAGLASQASALVGAKDLLARAEAQADANAALKVRLETTAGALRGVAQTVQTFRDEVLKALSTGDASQVLSQAEAALQQLGSALNQQAAGVYLFGGGNTASKPVVAGTLDELALLADPAEAFANGPVPQSARVDEGVVLDYGLLADAIGEPLAAVLRDVALFEAGPDGPLGSNMEPPQRAFLEGLLAGLSDAEQAVRGAESTNGINQARLEEVVVDLSARAGLLQDFIGGIQDADMAEAIARLNQDQTALQAAYRTLATLGELSLLRYL